MTTEEVTDYYADLLILQYRQLPKAQGHIKAIVRQTIIDLLPIAVQEAFDIETAVGKQLEILAKYVGASRQYDEPLNAREYFGFRDYVPANKQNHNGFRDYTNLEVNKTPEWFNYNTRESSTSTLSDTELRTLIKLRILTNSSDSSLSRIIDDLAAVFGDAINVRDNQNMTLTYTVDPSILAIPFGVLAPNLPRPLGVGIEVVVENNAFRFSRYDGVPTTRKGFRLYAGDPTGATFISYNG